MSAKEEEEPFIADQKSNSPKCIQWAQRFPNRFLNENPTTE